MKTAYTLITLALLLGACSSGIDPQVVQKQHDTMKKFQKLIAKQYICKGKVLDGSESGSITINFKNYPKSLDLSCDGPLYICGQGYIIDNFSESISIDTPYIYPKGYHSLEDENIKINNVQSNHLNIALTRSNDASVVDIDLVCSNPLEQITQIPQKVQKFKPSPYSDAELMQKLDKLLQYRANPTKSRYVQELLAYGVYISQNDIFKSLGTVYDSKYTPDYYVYELLRNNASMSEDEVLDALAQKSKEDHNDWYWDLVDNALDFAVYGNTEYRVMNGYAFAEYFMKQQRFDNLLLQYLDQLRDPMPGDLYTKIATYLATKYDNTTMIQLYVKNILLQPQGFKLLQHAAAQAQQKDIKYLNILLIKTLRLQSYKLSVGNGYFTENDWDILKKTKVYSSKKVVQQHQNELIQVVKSFLSTIQPDKITAEIYAQLKQQKQELPQQITQILQKHNITQVAHYYEYQKILAQMVEQKDQRGALFYLKKGAVATPKILNDALEKGMIPVVERIVLQGDVKYDKLSLLNKAYEHKEYQLINFLIDNNKLPQPDKLLALSYALLQSDKKEILNKLFASGVDKYQLMRYAQNRSDLQSMEYIASIGSSKEKRLLQEYKAELAHQKAQREAQRKAQELQKQKEQEALQRAYSKRKHVGETVCKDGRVALFLNITMKGFVEKVSGQNIKIHIVDTQGTTPYYNGVTLYRDSVIWDKYYEWRSCN